MDKTNETLADRIGDKQPQRRRTLTEIITEREAKAPPVQRGQGNDRWSGPRGPPSLWRLAKVVAVTGMGKSQIWKAISEGTFPRPVKILASGRAVGWVDHEVIAHIEQRIKARDQQAAK
jgi:prophage regulatory protein